VSGVVVLVTGGRDFADAALLCATLDKIHNETPILRLFHGGCRTSDYGPFVGADGLSHRWALTRGVTSVPCPVWEEEWTRIGPAAGPIRNRKMVHAAVELADRLHCESACVAFHTGGPGTRDCMRQARGARVRVLEVGSGDGAPENRS
jgi:hypothetical protein